MYLLDTHTLIWFLEGNLSLPERLVDTLRYRDNRLLVSVASFWEMSIKINLGKLTLPESLAEILIKTEQATIETLPIRPSHVIRHGTLPLYHRDPFDRMIIAQAIDEKLTVITKDENFGRYEVPVLW